MNRGPLAPGVLADPPARRRRPARSVRLGALLATGGVAAALALTGCAAGRDAGTVGQIPSQDGVNADVGAIALRGLAIEAPTGNPYYRPGSAAEVRLVLVNNGRVGDRLTTIDTSAASGWGAYSSTRSANQVIAAASASAAGITPSAASTSASPTTTIPASGTGSAGDTGSAGASSGRTSPANNAQSSPAGSPSGTVAATNAVAPATSAALPQPYGSVTIPAGQRASFGVPDSTAALLLLDTKGKLYPGDTVQLTFTFARAGTVTVAVPVQVSDSPGTASIPANGIESN